MHLGGISMSKFTHLGVLTALAAVVVAGSVAAAPVTLRASHQFPGGKGDVRDEMVQIIARDAKTASSTSRRFRSTTPAARCANSAPR
jgi:hypothetical protein